MIRIILLSFVLFACTKMVKPVNALGPGATCESHKDNPGEQFCFDSEGNSYICTLQPNDDWFCEQVIWVEE